MKTNDVTGRVKRGEIGVGLEFGRPGMASRLSDLEKMTVARPVVKHTMGGCLSCHRQQKASTDCSACHF